VKTLTTREELIKAGMIVPHEDLHDMFRDNVVSPTFTMPWHRDDVGLRLDARGKYWADIDVLQTIQEDYKGFPPSMAAARRLLP
jgi:hypothetical protein